MLREIAAERVSDVIRDAFLEANTILPDDMHDLIRRSAAAESSALGRSVLSEILENIDLAARERTPICQDCGMAVVFMDIGQDVHIGGGSLESAVDEGVRRAYRDGYLRASVVSDPLFDRKNTKDNTPAVLHVRIVPGDLVRVAVAPKGFGSENMSALAMLTPAAGRDGVVRFVTETIASSGPNPCPPIVAGIGIGGDFEGVALLAKRALLRPAGVPNPDPRYAALEADILKAANDLGIGPAGYGGSVTALSVSVEFAPTHIAGLPVAVNICCHANRHVVRVIGGSEGEER
jgi:fumarate hydratase subunit alpha